MGPEVYAHIVTKKKGKRLDIDRECGERKGAVVYSSVQRGQLR